jgi:hypothetical protein
MALLTRWRRLGAKSLSDRRKALDPAFTDLSYFELRYNLGSIIVAGFLEPSVLAAARYRRLHVFQSSRAALTRLTLQPILRNLTFTHSTLPETSCKQ